MQDCLRLSQINEGGGEEEKEKKKDFMIQVYIKSFKVATEV